MTYRGTVKNGTIVLEGEPPPDGTVVEITPVGAESGEVRVADTESLANHPAFGMWRDRTDLPTDSGEAARVLRERLMRRTDE